MVKKLILFFLVGLFIISFISLVSLVSAEDFGYNLLEPGKDLNPEANLSKKTVNASEIWITNEGLMDNVIDIEHNWLSNLLWSVAGHTIDIDFDIGDLFFNGKFNWTIGDSWNSFDGSTLNFNETHLNSTIHAWGFNETDALTDFYDLRYFFPITSIEVNYIY